MIVLGNILNGWLFWQKLKAKYKINYNKVLIVLSDDNQELDKQVLLHLPEFVRRKHVESAVVLCHKECMEKWKAILNNYDSSELFVMDSDEMYKLYSYYCFIKFFDNIVFTYTDIPIDNYLGRYLRETEITPEDAACLALYHLRYVPSKI